MTQASPPDEAELRELLATASRILHHQRLVDYLGHASARIPGTDRVLIKPRHSAGVHGLHTMTADRMVVLHLDGLAEVNYRVAQLGRPPRVIPPEEIAALKRHLASPAGRWAYYADLAG